MKVLLIAEACNPEWTSVPLVGWSHVSAIKKLPGVDAHLVTQIRNRDALLRQGLVDGQDFTAVDSEAVIAPVYKLASLLRGGAGKGWTMMTALASLAYPYFEYLVWKQFSDRVKVGEFDVVHRVTPVSPTAPSYLAKKCAQAGTPFVIGPLNGGVPWPREFDRERRQEKEWLSYIRGVYRWLPGYRSTRRFSSAIMVGSKDTLSQMPSRYAEKCIYMPENAIDPQRFPELNEEKNNTPPSCLRAAFVGRLVPYKGVDMLLEAAQPWFKQGLMSLDIYGDGPERSRLEDLAALLGIQGQVTFHGFVAHDQLHSSLSKADILTFPSIREFGGGVVLEAMASGVVPMVVDYGGPGELVTNDVGYLIEIGSRESIVAKMRDQLGILTEDRSQLLVKQAAGKERVKALFTWQAKAEQMKVVYEWVASSKGKKPDFYFS